MYIETLPLVVWTLLVTTTHVATQNQYGIGLGIKREVFFLNLEDGYFGCQVNESTQILQLYELSKLCDGVPDCYKASDELKSDLKCTDDCTKEDGAQCINGACLNGVCHCNDGFGGCNCQEPDINECKDRPCDVFAHCTNTVGSFQCSCFPGYEGDGFSCKDINECEDPAVASRCVENAECCNLPAHFICKCNRGFEGDGEEQCRDIDECRRPGACGSNAICQNHPGNYTCACQAGYTGNPFDGCVDVDECLDASACGAGAVCRNLAGGYECSCPPGYEGDPRVGCRDHDECSRASCGRDAHCENLPGAFRCVCPPGFEGDPDVQCTAVSCEAHDHCTQGLACIDSRCADPCARGGPCAPGHHCAVVDHQPVCSKVCQCQTSSDCARYPNTYCDGCACIKGDQPTTNCAHCRPGVPCDPFSGACMEIGCTQNEDCQLTEACINNACQHPCAIHNPCAQNAACINTNHGSDCSCAEGYQGNGYVGCVPVIDNSRSVCQYNEDCPPDLLCDRLNRVCINPCTMNKCGDNAECVPSNHGIQCKCQAGYTGNPFLDCYQVQGCRNDNECANSEACINGECGSPCRCGANAVCDVLNHRATCKCLRGYKGNPKLGCEPPQNPCIPNPCGISALCESDNGNPICYCPKGLTGNPFKTCIPEGNECEPNPCGPFSGCRLIDNRPACFCLPNYEGNPPTELCRLPSNPCNPSPCGPNTQCTVLSNGFAKCTCLNGYIESPNTVRGCVEARNPCEPNTCGVGARCDPNRIPACYCPDSTAGNPYKSCNKGYLPPDNLCQPGPCGLNADCYVSSNREMCFCKTGFVGNPYTGCQAERNPCTLNLCGPQAVCDVNFEGQAICSCAEGSSGDPYGVNGCLSRECEVDDECSQSKACIGYTCRDPCPGVCGLNAKCYVASHRPTCVCEDGLIGNPFICCLPPEDQKSIRPCNKVQCGVNALCQDVGDRAVCTCPPEFYGDANIECKPECLMNSDCESNEACINSKCRDPCSSDNICGINAVCICSEHTVSCLCPEGYIGDPLTQCIYRPIIITPDNTTVQACSPNPCDPNSPCDSYGNQFAICDACVGPDAVNNPSCRPECVLSSDCAFNKACLRNKCVDPCPGSCGVNAECVVYHHDPICRCTGGFEGNPYELCKPATRPVVQENCDNVRCGDNAYCQDLNGALSCKCLQNFYGNPYLSCRPECVVNSDCAPDLACLNNKCENPCQNVCGMGALCKTVSHHAVCHCEPGFTGDPYIRCQNTPILPPALTTCDPSPCGPYSRCLLSSSGFAVCSCLPGHRGVAPMCQPECVSNSDCQQTEICVSQRCSNPCQGSCGINAECIVINHNPICSCGPGKTGDPFVACGDILEGDRPIEKNPCVPSPCGPNSVCEIVSSRPVCSCRPNYSGTPPYCRPECVISQECPSHQACINEKCVDPCLNACGNNAKCNVVNHTPLCSCLEGYKGDAFIGCVAIAKIDTPTPCDPSPCGDNTICTVQNNIARCSCIPPNIGNPYAGGCRPECTINSECPNHLACLSNHCRDPCKDLCGVNAECTVTNHVPVCTCFNGYEGNPFSSCREAYRPNTQFNPCEPSPCGPNSECNVVSDRAACVCHPGFLGAPPACRPECAVNSDCPTNKACISLKCKDPCVHSCGLDARCHVVSHNPICTCPENLPEGDPFIRCYRKNISYPAPDPCLPSPCGPYSTCRNVNGRATCSCEPGMLGAPPTCRRQCVINQDCPLALACLAGSCVNPCIGSCGFNARCIVQNHQPICSCDEGYAGDPFAGCSPAETPKEVPRHPCNPSPCGPNAICRERDGAGSCTCVDDFFGDPYLGCRPECVMNTDCAMDRSCFNNKCVNPCSGSCGQNAECRVANHAPSCSCLPGYVGNPLHACAPVLILPEPVDPCRPSPCGPYSNCRIFNEHAVCTCLDLCVGSPPNCRPECIVSSDCRPDKACINQKCQDPCAGMCGVDARCQVVNHNPICSCPNGYSGDPFVKCFLDRPMIHISSCTPSPCGPHSHCNEVNGVPVCSCIRNYVGRPPNCRPECVINVECPGNLACISERCSDPCPGSCGYHATCSVVKHVPICSCDYGYTGDPFSGCSIIPTIEPQVVSPCSISPCGANAICKERHGIGSCSCLLDYYGDPYIECRPECVLNSDCPKDKACFNNKCKDPCPGVCGMNAECRVHNHAPSCACLPEYEGNPFTSCHLRVNDQIDPCLPSPCGPYSICRVANSHAICSCQEEYFGTPPLCRPECMVSSECMPNRACMNQKCVDPCIAVCGDNAKCTVVNHNALCSCPHNYVGDPFVRCSYEKRPEPRPNANPCVPSPCGPHSQCRIVGETPACSCQIGYVGRAPNCRPECIYDEECPSNLACVRDKCVSPCEGSCGSNAECIVINHKAVCHCRESYSGDPFSGCQFILNVPSEEESNPCNPSPCGPNSVCTERNNAGSCTCQPGYFGDPYLGCRPECVTNNDCPLQKSCSNNKCIDPCQGACGLNAYCTVAHHTPVCLCIEGYEGNPGVSCFPQRMPSLADSNPCMPSPCGPYSICKEVNGHGVCSCQESYIGAPPTCRPECVISTDCPQHHACIKQKCADPCPGTCGVNARCQTINHNPICTCRVGFTGDPFVTCHLDQKPITMGPNGNPCIPSPCGPYSQCKVVGEVPACSCLPNYIGVAPNCRPECSINAECPGNLACQNEKCVDPCPGSCGFNAECSVANHVALCHCILGYAGDPFSGCSEIERVSEPPPNPCNPSPCGPNALCIERNGIGSCTCLPEYFGDPYTGCRPECVSNSDCDRNKACSNNRCKDPCPGACGINAECRTVNHSPTCTCLSGYSGNPLVRCDVEVITLNPVDPCQPSPCGPNSLCRVVNGHSVCTCEIGFIGTPPSCRPECIVSSECPQNKACINKKCIDPCPNTCGLNARCQVITHNPICSCTPGFTGDPFTRCEPDQGKVLNTEPCSPSPCGPNSECRVIGDQAACSCLPNYIGRVPNCRPECTIDAECPSNTACINERCKNPCQGACGSNALCLTVYHKPVCSCQQGYTGDANSNCFEILAVPEVTSAPSPCSPSPCGPNSECREHNGAGACVCSEGYEGDPYSAQGCRRECENNDDCASNLECIQFKCIDPCPRSCGQMAECTVENHIPICNCPKGYSGDPFFECRKYVQPPPPPCEHTPCGPNSICREINGQAVCSCLPNYVGSPPGCRPECVVNSECDTSKACINQKCDDPCPNTCGLRAYCMVKNHNPICTCPASMTGDPFTQCYPVPQVDEQPSCTPSPCGPHSRCQLLSTGPACSCLPGYIGSPPACRPECTINSECPASLACLRKKCEDPCPGSCGVDANCHVLNHVAVCVCNEGYTGDPFSRCVAISQVPTTTVSPDPCNPSPCGPNALCDNGLCTCLSDYSGNPYESCRPECTGSQECTRDKACFRNKCRDPCPGVCGQNSKCDVINHIPTCSCIAGYTGNPFTHCQPIDNKQLPPRNPCHPSSCGPNSICRLTSNNTAACACLEGFQGTPPMCRPECVVSSECASTKACVSQKCINPCINACGVSARCEVINHSPICSCNSGQTGDPFKNCYDVIESPNDDIDVCNPSPCGPNSACIERNGKPNCRCVDSYIGQPPNCRPECVINSDCPSNQACVMNKCLDPCPGSCGINADCIVVSHMVSCICQEKYTGNPFLQCIPREEIIAQPCDPSPCGANAICNHQNGAGSCTCSEGYQGNPYEGCRPECVLSSDCSADKSCIRNKCADPCPGICGSNAECSVINHVPTCACVKGYSGNPFEQCKKNEISDVPVRPCQPSPCGPNSICRESGGLASCECLPDYIGTPPDCRPECTVSSECPPDRACHQLKCADPCRGTCGIGAHCQVINHSPLCSCPIGTSGDPFSRCYEVSKTPVMTTQPCQPNPCGPYSECRPVNGNPSCSCTAGYLGTPPNCHPECLVNTDCPSHQACIAEKCTNPCEGSCGFRSECRVHNHIPICSCPTGYSGDPFIQCMEIIRQPNKPLDLCNPSPCGSNANCDAGKCTCVTSYFGDPYVGCRHECATNGECSPTRACHGGKCVDPCPGACGTGARCSVNNHIPACTCPPSTSGDPFSFCTEIVQTEIQRSACSPSPCGPYSECTVSANGAAACSCRAGHIGSPPSCRPECLGSSECKLQLACIDRRCRDPCEGACGRGAKCQVIAHSPICTCNDGYTGDPFTYCYPAPAMPPINVDPCEPSPCGPNSICVKAGDTPACTCQPGYIGGPPNCRPECTISAECPAAFACVAQRCKDPCEQACGPNAICSVVDHRATCACELGLEGDPFQGCSLPREKTPNVQNPCIPSPCGPGAICRVRGTGASCECETGLHGDPYSGCRPECLADSDCSPTRACIRSKCHDPCQGTCGVGADCETINHIPLCSCPTGTRGNAFEICEVIPSAPPCTPSPCGPGALCTLSGNTAVCSCPRGTSGDAASGGCRPECVVSSECARDRACVRNKCVDPCVGACGNGAICRVIDHAPICSCPSLTTGDPFLQCRATEATVSEDPCDPNPCGLHGTCRDGFCSYPECIVNDDCPGDRACINRKCTDPCVNACGLNALCTVVRHSAVCSCPAGYTGSAFVRCERILISTPPPPEPECVRDEQCPDNAACVDLRCTLVCGPNNCGTNARCLARQHRARCACLPGFEGDAYRGCYSVQCHSNNDCPDDESCEGGSCVKVCSRIHCGPSAHCVARGHTASCECDAGARGNPWTGCRRGECSVDEDCATWLACRGGVCQNPCPGACAQDALCTVVRHSPVCECPRGTQGNPKIECKPVLEHAECEKDADCGPGLACLQGNCKNPCETTSCGARAVCRVANTLPFRTLVCECPRPLTGDASVQCNPRGECTTDVECGLEERCLSGRCVGVCTAMTCGAGAECRAADHAAECRCLPPLQGDPKVACTPGPAAKCTTDSQCGAAEACVSQRCVSACAGACGSGALCSPLDHRAACRCPPGTAGDPSRLCYTPECSTDENCPFDKTCMKGYCQDPCALGSPCGRSAVCEAVAHVAACRCPPGTQGDPRRACISAVCHYNEDCDDSQTCNRLNRVCQPACSDDACAPGATCTARNHRQVCTCRSGLSGDAYLQGCTKQTTSECVTDADCASPLACVNSRCTDLCIANPCDVGLVCKTVDILPLRAVACICPDGGRVAPDSGCRSPPQAECSADIDCALSQVCRRGSCVDACRVDPCGQNALCESVDHAAHCSCPEGYSGNPKTECNVEPRQAIPECYIDNDCSTERACRERMCVNPCANACGVGALCRVIDHKPQCSCPRGYSGIPTMQCIPPSDQSVITVGCKANSDCPLSQACINSACANPCACGPSAECTVVRHHPVCFCERGYSGNPYIGCTKVGCTSDSQCSDSDTCYNGACVNPCVVEAPCAISAECFGKAHRPNCRCPLGSIGDPYTRCQTSECEVNSDCNDDSVCIRGVCRNACSSEGQSPCANNAECYARNHAASCKCPPALPSGDPLTHCLKIPVIGEPECHVDSDCPSSHACLRDECREACSELKPCTGGARCSVSDSIPFRTLVCRCPEGYVPDEAGSCKSAQLPAPSCSSDSDCSEQESCVNRICRNPCNCGENAECFVRDHRPVCSCREGFDGDPYRTCRIVGCRADSECESNEACVNGNCISPCLLNSTCGPNAECHVDRNRPLCRCRNGFEGDAYAGCNAIECRTNGDCPLDKQCHAHRCINPCLLGNTCGLNAKCLVRNHIPVCKCDTGYIGSPYVECRPEIIAECFVDGDCPSRYACLSSKCLNPCAALHPCSTPARCEVSPTLPVRTMLCTCPPGYISNGGGVCRPTTPIADAVCELDNDCTSNHACITSLCKNPCDCGPNTDCLIKEHKPVCACRPGFIGDARTGCYKVLCQSDSQCSDDESCINNRCVPACTVEPDVCGTLAECYGLEHKAACRCNIGTTGNPSIGCTPIGCRADSDCPPDKSCINSKCVNPCTASTCDEPSECRVHLHEAHCVCPPGYRSTETSCEKIEQPQCTSDVECPLETVCLNAECVNPCQATKPCGINAGCKVIDTLPVRTMICECIPGYRGNALVECTPNITPSAACIEGQGLNALGECAPCRESEGRTVDARGRCVCDTERGWGARGGECVRIACSADRECDDKERCINGVCVDACEAEPCGKFAICDAYGHRSHCTCTKGYSGNPRIQCNETTMPNVTYRTDFPLPEMQVHCLANGIRVSLKIKEGFNGLLYVKGYSKDERCGLVVNTPVNQESPVDFTVHFGNCGLVHVNGLASFVLVMQDHLKLVTSNAKAFHIKCIYQTGEKNVTLAFNVSMLTTAGTIANTGPPPVCAMRIVTRTGDAVSSATVGENLTLQVDVQPSSIYGGFARSCIAKTSEVATNVENEYTVTDADGCATDPSIFGEWEHSDDGTLKVLFNAFKFPSSDNIKFQCNIRICFGKCQPVNCRGRDSFGKRRKREAIDSDGSLSGIEGQLREEVMVESNQILTLERRSASRAARQREGDAGAGGGGGGEVCVSAAGLAVALALTALLALVAVAAAVACWLVAWRRARPPPAPLPHPPDFPNPLFQR